MQVSIPNKHRVMKERGIFNDKGFDTQLMNRMSIFYDAWVSIPSDNDKVCDNVFNDITIEENSHSS